MGILWLSSHNWDPSGVHVLEFYFVSTVPLLISALVDDTNMSKIYRLLVSAIVSPLYVIYPTCKVCYKPISSFIQLMLNLSAGQTSLLYHW